MIGGIEETSASSKPDPRLDPTRLRGGRAMKRTSLPLQRREFITLLGGAAAAWPLGARAQQNFRRIGVLMTLPENSQEGQGWVAAFKEGLQKVGWSESRNIRIDARWGATDAASQRLARQVIATQPDLILAQNTPTTLALQQLTTTIPIIFANIADPVG